MARQIRGLPGAPLLWRLLMVGIAIALLVLLRATPAAPAPVLRNFEPMPSAPAAPQSWDPFDIGGGNYTP